MSLVTNDLVTNDLVGDWTGKALQHPTSLDRYAEVGCFAWRPVGKWGLGISVVLLAGFWLWASRDRHTMRAYRAGRWLGFALARIVLGYFFVFVTTPLNQDLHLRTSIARLACHLWSTALFLVFVTRRDDLFALQP